MHDSSIEELEGRQKAQLVDQLIDAEEVLMDFQARFGSTPEMEHYIRKWRRRQDISAPATVGLKPPPSLL